MEYYYKKQSDGEWFGPYSETEIAQYSKYQIFVPVYNYSEMNKYILDTLQQKRLKLSLPSKMNDPFECLPALPNKWLYPCAPVNEIPDNLNKIRESLDRSILFRSFTKYHLTANVDETLLWSHYARNHTGIRIGYAWSVVPYGTKLQGSCYYLEDIIYTNTRPVFPPSFPNISQDDAREFAWTIAKTKSQVWQYENEIRLLATPIPALKEIFPDESPIFEDIFEKDGLTFLRLWSDNIFSIDLGCQFSDEDFKKKILEAVEKNYPHVRVHKAIMPTDEYVLKYHQIFP